MQLKLNGKSAAGKHHPYTIDFKMYFEIRIENPSSFRIDCKRNVFSKAGLKLNANTALFRLLQLIHSDFPLGKHFSKKNRVLFKIIANRKLYLVNDCLSRNFEAKSFKFSTFSTNSIHLFTFV